MYSNLWELGDYGPVLALGQFTESQKIGNHQFKQGDIVYIVGTNTFQSNYGLFYFDDNTNITIN